ncbi:hypothetical protein ACFQ0M_13325 [Kitasatospora aburaviensis]
MTSTVRSNGVLGRRGLRTGVEWSAPEAARARAAQLVAEHLACHQEIVRNPHLSAEWARAAVRARSCCPPSRASSGRMSRWRTPSSW